MAHKLCHAFFLSDRFLRNPFHMENTEKTILCIVSRLRAAFADLRFTLSCIRFAHHAPVHAFYRPMVTYYCAQSGRVRRQAAYIQPFFRSTHPVDFLDCGRLVFNDCHVSAPFFPVGNYFKTVIYVVGSCLDPPMAKLRPSVYEHKGICSLRLSSTPQRSDR